MVNKMEALLQGLQTAHEVFDGTARWENASQQKRKRASDDDQLKSVAEVPNRLTSDGENAAGDSLLNRRQKANGKRKRRRFL
jgi:hypothetical protein